MFLTISGTRLANPLTSVLCERHRPSETVQQCNFGIRLHAAEPIQLTMLNYQQNRLSGGNLKIIQLEGFIITAVIIITIVVVINQ